MIGRKDGLQVNEGGLLLINCETRSGQLLLRGGLRLSRRHQLLLQGGHVSNGLAQHVVRPAHISIRTRGCHLVACVGLMCCAAAHGVVAAWGVRRVGSGSEVAPLDDRWAASAEEARWEGQHEDSRLAVTDEWPRLATRPTLPIRYSLQGLDAARLAFPVPEEDRDDLLGQSKQLGQGGGVSGSGLWLRCLRWRRVIWMRRPLAWLIKQLLARVILQKTSRQASLIPWRSELGALRKRFACSSSGLETRAEDEDDVTDEELREIERQHCDSSLDHVREMRTRWFAQQVSASTPADAVSSAHNEQVTSGQSGARSALLVHDLQWYDQAVTLAFRHSWCVVRKWNAHEVALELETETDFRRRKKRAQLERFQSAAKGL